MIRNKAYKFRLIPNKIQQDQINKTLGCCRCIYNLMLAERKILYDDNIVINNMERMNGCSEENLTKLERKYKTEHEYKKEFEWLKEASAVALQQSHRDLDQAYTNFFRKHKNGKKTSLKFKSKRNSNSSYRTMNNNDSIRIKDNKIRIPKIGWVKFKKSKDVKGIIKNITVSKNILNK